MMDRRTFLKTASVGAVAVASAGALGAEPPASRIIDTHTHFYDPERPQGVPWPTKGSSLYRKVLPADWLAVAAPLGVKETVVVEASKWLEDNQWVLDLAEKEKCIVGVVGNLAPADVDLPKHLKRFAANPLYRGIRVSGNFLNRVDPVNFKRGVRALADAGIALEMNAQLHLLAYGAELAGELPALRVVIDHVGGAGDSLRLTKRWRANMKLFGEQKNVFCKVSGLIEQTAASDAQYGDASRETAYYKPILDHCWECFGAERLIYGSNWPVCEKGGTYADQFKIVSEYFSDKGREACESYFWKNAVKAYGLKG